MIETKENAEFKQVKKSEKRTGVITRIFLVVIVAILVCGISMILKSPKKTAHGFADAHFEEAVFKCIEKHKEYGYEDASIENIAKICLEYGYLEVEFVDGFMEDTSFEYDEMKSLEDLKLFPNLKVVEVEDLVIKRATSVFTEEQRIEELKLSEIRFGGNKDTLQPFFEHYTPLDIELFLSEDFDLNWLNDIENVEKISLTVDEIKHIEKFKNCTKLKQFILYTETPVELMWFSKNKQLETFVVDNVVNDVFDIALLKDLKNLKSLAITTSECDHIELLSEFSKLESLNIEYCDLDGNIPTEGLMKLKNIEVRGTQIKSIDPLPPNDFDEIDISYNKLEDVAFLSNVKSIERLWICENEVKDYSPLRAIENVETFLIGNVKNFDIENITHMPNVKFILLDESSVVNIDSISQIKSLETLTLTNMNLKEVPDLSGLSNLKDLDLSRNDIQDISALRELHSLEYVNISWNPVKENGDLSDFDFEIKAK